MRDILLTLILIGLVPVILRSPVAGALAWAWVAVMSPHRMAFGFAASLPFAQIVAILTFVSYFINQKKHALPMSGGTVLLIGLMIWMTISSIFSINEPEQVWNRWLFVAKINVMLLFTLMILRGRKEIEMLIWVIVASIGYFGVKGGLWTIIAGGTNHVYGPPGGMLLDNNAFAVGLIIILPLMYYLQQVASDRRIRWALLISMVLCVFSILGSQSRGGLLGLLAVVSMLGLKSKYPVRSLVVLSALVLIGVAFMPDSWTQRMDTIQGYEGDSSAMSRLWTWTTLWNVAVARPFVGAGYGAENPMIFMNYAPIGPQYEVFQGKAWVAHSIYFQALGEHGFPGLFLYLALGLWIWFAAGSTARKAQLHPELAAWMPLLMRMVQTSLLGFAVGGAFLSLMNLDVPYYLMAFVVLAQLILRENVKKLSAVKNSHHNMSAGRQLQQ